MNDEGRVIVGGPYATDIPTLARISDEDFQEALTELQSIEAIELLKSEDKEDQIQVIKWELFVTGRDYAGIPPQKESA